MRKSLDIETGGTVRVGQDYEKVIKANDHFITWDLAPNFEDLFARYGDISAESTLQSPKVKMYFIMIRSTKTNKTTRKFDKKG